MNRVRAFARSKMGKLIGHTGATFARAGARAAFGKSGANRVIGALSGKGDYRLGGRKRKYSAARSKHRSTRPRGASSLSSNGEMVISHSEYIGELISGNVTGPSVFTSQLYGINPANSATFPWLSAIAANFQGYKFEKLVFEYRPLISESTSTSAATLTSMGTCMFATQYDSVQGPYLNKSQMENSDFSCSTKPSERMMMAVECKPQYNPLGVLYTSPSITPTNSGTTNADIRMQNLALVQVASVNVPIAGNTALDLGELWVHYKVKLMKPQAGSFGAILSCHMTGNAATGQATGSTPFGPNITAAIQPTNAPGSLITPVVTASGLVTLPVPITEGNYLIYYNCQAGASNATIGFNAPINCTFEQVFHTDTLVASVAPQNSLAGVTSTTICGIFAINAPGALQASFVIQAGNLGAAGVYDFFITQINDNIMT